MRPATGIGPLAGGRRDIAHGRLLTCGSNTVARLAKADTQPTGGAILTKSIVGPAQLPDLLRNTIRVFDRVAVK